MHMQTHTHAIIQIKTQHFFKFKYTLEAHFILLFFFFYNIVQKSSSTTTSLCGSSSSTANGSGSAAGSSGGGCGSRSGSRIYFSVVAAVKPLHVCSIHGRAQSRHQRPVVVKVIYFLQVAVDVLPTTRQIIHALYSTRLEESPASKQTNKQTNTKKKN